MLSLSSERLKLLARTTQASGVGGTVARPRQSERPHAYSARKPLSKFTAAFTTAAGYCPYDRKLRQWPPTRCKSSSVRSGAGVRVLSAALNSAGPDGFTRGL